MPGEVDNVCIEVVRRDYNLIFYIGKVALDQKQKITWELRKEAS